MKNQCCYFLVPAPFHLNFLETKQLKPLPEGEQKAEQRVPGLLSCHPLASPLSHSHSILDMHTAVTLPETNPNNSQCTTRNPNKALDTKNSRMSAVHRTCRLISTSGQEPSAIHHSMWMIPVQMASSLLAFMLPRGQLQPTLSSLHFYIKPLTSSHKSSY